MKLLRRISLALPVGIAAAAVAVAVTAAPAQAESYASGTTAQAENQVAPLYINDCADELKRYGYSITLPRVVFCTVAALNYPDPARAIAACTTGLVGTGVSPFVAPLACLLGSFA